jgi:nucleoside-diphosphate-sugar epimerase
MKQMQRVFVTGGAGYVGSALVPDLLMRGYEVTVYDLFIYGEDVIDSHPNLKLVKGDIRDLKRLAAEIPDHDAIIHLACISNDPSFELNPELGRAINLDPFRPLVEISRDSGVSKFIYASSSSVYGVKDVENVTENMSLEPLTDYSKFKAQCEEILLEYETDTFTTAIVRPATVCGYARRQRLDVVVNILSNLAFHNREITIFGGDQLRPNINILDMVRVYVEFLEAPRELIGGQIFNAGYENYSVSQLGEMVVDVFGADVSMTKTETDDNRSYHVSSSKMKEVLGFETKYTIKDAIKSLKKAFQEQLLNEPMSNEMYVNIKRMKSINLS